MSGYVYKLIDPTKWWPKRSITRKHQHIWVSVTLNLIAAPSSLTGTFIYSTAQKFLVAFSIHRNWYLLSAPTKPEMRDLRSISAVRIWTMIPIIYGHCSWFAMAVPVQNPFFIENVSLWIFVFAMILIFFFRAITGFSPCSSSTVEISCNHFSSSADSSTATCFCRMSRRKIRKASDYSSKSSHIDFCGLHRFFFFLYFSMRHFFIASTPGRFGINWTSWRDKLVARTCGQTCCLSTITSAGIWNAW